MTQPLPSRRARVVAGGAVRWGVGAMRVAAGALAAPAGTSVRVPPTVPRRVSAPPPTGQSRQCCNATAISLALVKRAPGSFSSACSVRAASGGGTARLSRSGGAGVSWTCLKATPTALSPMKGSAPVSAS